MRSPHAHAPAHAFILLCAAASSSLSDGGDPATTPLDIAVSAGDGAVPGVTDGVKAMRDAAHHHRERRDRGADRATASRGTFPNGATAMIAGTTGSLELQVCDARTDTLCGGTLTITAFDGKQGYGQKKLTLVGFEQVAHQDDNGDRRSDCGDRLRHRRRVSAAAGARPAPARAGCARSTCTPTGDTRFCTNATDDDCDRPTARGTLAAMGSAPCRVADLRAPRARARRTHVHRHAARHAPAC